MSSTDLHPEIAQGTSPANPGALYTLDWTLPGEQQIPPAGWVAEWIPTLRHADGEPQIRVAKRSLDQPVRATSNSARFHLEYTDPVVPGAGSVRAELSASGSGLEPVSAKRWYGFSIYLPPSWTVDPSPEILTQWHHDREPSGQLGSPPLGIQTRNGKWEIVQRVWSTNDTRSLWTSPTDYVTGEWVDWVVHVEWSGDSRGVLEIWQRSRSQPKRKVVSLLSSQNTFPGARQYMKIGIYKWQWNRNPRKPTGTPAHPVTRRVMYHDEVRIADGGIAGVGYETVQPRGTAVPG